MASSHYGELSVTVQMCRNLHLPEIGGSLRECPERPTTTSDYNL